MLHVALYAQLAHLCVHHQQLPRQRIGVALLAVVHDRLAAAVRVQVQLFAQNHAGSGLCNVYVQDGSVGKRFVMQQCVNNKKIVFVKSTVVSTFG